MSSKENILKAVESINNRQLTYRKASQIYGVPKSTLFSRVNSSDPCKERKKGRNLILTESLEEELAQYVIRMCDKFYGCTSLELRKTATELALANNISIKGELLGYKWLQGKILGNFIVSK